MVQVHGLAATIRSATESETFDLGGLSASTIETVFQQAFEKGFSLPDDEVGMIRLTFVVGAGKQARQKYDAQALKTVTSTLQSMGYTEDRGASCVRECAGMFKHQHDTGKNLKTVVVFPLLSSVSTEDDDNAENATLSNSSSLLLPAGSMESKVAISTLPTFRNMVQAKCPTWSQKKALLQLLDDQILSKVTECDNLLIRGQPLSPEQQAFYDGCTGLTDKRVYLQEQLQAHVEQGTLTAGELTMLKEQVQQKISELTQQGKPSTKGKERLEKLKKITNPIDLPKLKNYAALAKLWKQVAPLQHLDENSNKLLSVQDTKLLGQKMELLEEIQQLEQSSKGWLESEEQFQSRVQAARSEFYNKFGIGSKKNSSRVSKKSSAASKDGPTINSSTKVRVPVSKWVTPTETHHQAAKAKAKAKQKKGDIFGAMMAKNAALDDEEEDEEEDEEQSDDQLEAENEETSTANTKNKQSASSNNATAGSSPSKGKRKNKKKGKRNHNDDMAFLDAAVEANKPKKDVSEEEQDKNNTALSVAVYIVRDIVMPIIMALVTWILVMVLGKPKPKKKKE